MQSLSRRLTKSLENLDDIEKEYDSFSNYLCFFRIKSELSLSAKNFHILGHRHIKNPNIHIHGNR
jgi:hypothetical protein